MKNIFLKLSLVLSLSLITYISCNTESDNSIVEESTIEKMNKIEPKLKKDQINLGKGTHLKFKDKKAALKKLKNINNELKTILDKDKYLVGVVYSIIITNDEIEISNFNFTEVSSKTDQYTFEDEVVDSYDCPTGQTLVKNAGHNHVLKVQ